jgi:hypothetical protein
MLNFILGFFFGATVVDFLWARKFGIPQAFWARIKGLKVKLFNNK